MFQAINNFVAKFISFFADKASLFGDNLNAADYSYWQVGIDILLTAILFYWLILLIRGSRATNIILGLVVLTFLFLLSRILNLLAVGWILDRLLTVILVAIPIIFQQELRRGLEKLGRTKFFLAKEAKELDFLKSEIIEACLMMVKKHMGSLIVFRQDVSLKEYVDTGIMMNAKISKELILSVFSSMSPLHDGAVIIDNGRILSAGCVLPHSFKEYGHSFGTRHKAGLALSESTDARVIVISEQKGTVSFVVDGEIEQDIGPERLAELLDETFSPKK